MFLLGFFDYEICSTFCFRVLKKGGKNNDGENYQVSFVFYVCFDSAYSFSAGTK